MKTPNQMAIECLQGLGAKVGGDIVEGEFCNCNGCVAQCESYIRQILAQAWMEAARLIEQDHYCSGCTGLCPCGQESINKLRTMAKEIEVAK